MSRFLCLATVLCLTVCGTAGCGYMLGPSNVQGVRTIHVPIFKSDSFRRNLDYLLTEAVQSEFEQIKSISIDYAVMERAAEVAVIEAPFDWDDVGSWTSLERLRGTDDQGNTTIGKCLSLETKNSILRTEGKHLVATVGVQDLIVVHTPDATLVANRHDEESVRKIVQLLEERGWQEYM